LRRDPEEGLINISEPWENYFDHIIEEETPENAYRMIDFLLWTACFRCLSKGIGNTPMRTQISKEERRKKWKQNRYQSRNKSSAVVGEGMEAYALLKSPWHHHAQGYHCHIHVKHASTSTKHLTGIWCYCKNWQQQRKTKTTQTSVILTHNYQILVNVAHNCWPGNHL
jgi:hypothetical protein